MTNFNRPSARNFRLITTVAIALIGLGSSACTKKNENSGSSVISLSVPDVGGSAKGTNANQKVGSFAALPANRRACFGINVIADDIPAIGTECSPKMGIVAGFVESGGTIQVEVPRGENRTFELYLYLLPDGETMSCPTMGKTFAAADLPKLYNLGSTPNIAIRNAVEEVTITASFPGLTQSLLATNSLPSSCGAVAAPSTPPKQRTSAASGVAIGGSIKLIGRVGDVKGTALTGGGIRLKTQ